MTTEQSLIDHVEERVKPLGFRRAEAPAELDGIAIAAAWVRKTWNTNRGIACIRIPPGARAGEVSQSLKIKLGKALGYFPFFYGIGLQIICVGQGESDEGLKPYVDAIDNQRSIIQSLFAVDVQRGAYASARTWGQVITGRFQDAIEAALRESIKAGA